MTEREPSAPLNLSDLAAEADAADDPREEYEIMADELGD